MRKREQNENSEESVTIINEDNFEILNPPEKKENDNNNDKIKKRPKTNYKKERKSVPNKIQIKDIKEEEQLRFDFQKEYKKFKPNRNKNVFDRMIDDINKRGNMEYTMNKFIKQSKLKMNEENLLEIFNRLIDDTNRRLEEKEKIIQFKEDEEKDNIELLKKALNKDNKKYNGKEWSKIYHKRFETFSKNRYKNFIKNVSNVLREEIELIEEEKPKKIIKIKNKKEAKQIIENNIKNLYNDYMIRKQKMINKENNFYTINNKNKLLNSDKLNKINKVKKCIKSESKNRQNKIKNNINLKENLHNNSNNKRKFCFTPKSLKSRNIYDNSNNKNKQNTNNNNNYYLGGNKISDILINTFLMNHGK